MSDPFVIRAASHRTGIRYQKGRRPSKTSELNRWNHFEPATGSIRASTLAEEVVG